MFLKQMKVSDMFTTSQFPRVEKHPPENVKSISKQITEFAEKTSCHGVKRVMDQHTLNNWYCWKNIVWLLLTMAGLVMAIQSLVVIFTDYTSHPVSTLLEREFENVAEFPTITFCNLNLLVAQIWSPYIYYQQKWDIRNQYSAPENRISNEVKLRELSAGFSMISQDDQKLIGLTLEEMLVDCEFDGEPCTADDFYWIYNFQYGNCYSFNFGLTSNGSQQAIRQIRKVGKGSGLTLTLDTRSESYLPMTDEVGIKLVIHKAKEYPYMEEQGMFVAPGFITNIGLNKEEKILPEPPYGICTPSDPQGNRDLNMYASSGFDYSAICCIKSCQQAHVIVECGCCDRNSPCNPDGFKTIFGITLPNEGNVQQCDMSWDASGPCVSNHLSYLAQNRICEGKCSTACKTTSFEVKQSFSLWPNKLQVPDIFDKINGSDRLENAENASVNEKNIFIRDNVLKLDAYFESQTKTVVITQPTYTWNLLLSNVGGQLGLWLGFSLLTAFEFFELLLDVVLHGSKMAWTCCKLHFVKSTSPIV